ncbi:VOC family protein [Actinomycetospora chiangmaiensis]|uniref:VOC family protein n=1 Tax=Actinomycetospora chiangmaiensis TaxID=402650 RepID=UPI001FE1C464|nr:VOC family protein [Actinomycetospora chiangmaiensis]
MPVLVYPDVRAAVAWLTEALGFVERLRIGEAHRSQLHVGDGAAVIVTEPRGGADPRGAAGEGAVTASVMVRIDNLREHCETARSCGARITMEPADFEYGETQYQLEDPFGHRWTFTETYADVDPSDWGGILLAGD